MDGPHRLFVGCMPRGRQLPTEAEWIIVPFPADIAQISDLLLEISRRHGGARFTGLRTCLGDYFRNEDFAHDVLVPEARVLATVWVRATKSSSKKRKKTLEVSDSEDKNPWLDM